MTLAKNALHRSPLAMAEALPFQKLDVSWQDAWIVSLEFGHKFLPTEYDLGSSFFRYLPQ